MEILSGIASKLGELLVDATVKQARYLFCFNSIVKELEDQETNLKEAQDGISKKVEQERQKHCAIVVEKDVEKWLANVVKEMADVRNLKEKIDEKKSCFNGWCPNWGFRYWMGRKASKETRKLSELQDRGKFSTVALPKPLPSDKEIPVPRFFSSFETTESACSQIIEALKKDSTKMVGLHGLGGVGKTTLAKFVGNKLRQKKIFDMVGVATVSQDPNIINVQSELVKSLGWALTEKGEEDRADRLRLMFSESKSRKILIILDDVWKEFDLETVGIPVSDRDNCCKILLTTRLQQVCDRMGCDTRIKLDVLDQAEGLDLLRKHAGIDVVDKTLTDVSKRVADECKGLPLAIKAVGSALRGRTADEWNVALDKLQNAKLNKIEGIDRDSQDVYGCLKFSYDYLNGEDSRSCFLLCSLFPEDYKIDLEDLLGHAVGLVWYQAESIEKARSLLRGTIKGLKDSSLLLDTDDERFVKMHDVVRDVALWIGEMEKKYFTSKIGIGLVERAVEEGLEQYRGISLVGNEKEELPSGLVCHNLHILRLENTENDKKLQVPEHFFKEMPALKVVTIIGGDLSLKSLQILTNLQVLQLIRCEVSDTSFLGKLKRLQILYLEESPIEIPDELGDELSRLKLLYIDTCSISPITITKFPQLEEFYGLIKNWAVERMSSEESCARYAESDSQPDGSVVCLPKDFSFPKLQRYDISKVDSDDYGIIRGTRCLCIEDNHPKATLVIFSALYPELEMLYLDMVRGCHNIVPSIDERGLNELTLLDVDRCKDLECIMDASKSPHGKGGNPVMLSRLAELYMWELPELKWIWKAPAQHVSLQTLAKLSVSECNRLTYIFTLSQARSLVQLKTLEVSNCKRLECIIEAKFDHNEREISAVYGNTILALPLLRELRFEDLPKLMSFCSENYYSTWPALEELDLRRCPKLSVNSTELEANLQYLGEKLRILKVGECSHLRDTIDALLKHGFKNLETLYIGELGVQVVFQVEAIIAEGQENKLFPCLKELELNNLRELQVLYHEGPTHNFRLQNLTRLTVKGCAMLRRLFSSKLARNLLQLEELSVSNCSELEQIIDEDEDEDLRELQVLLCHEGPTHNCSLQNLTDLTVSACTKLRRLLSSTLARNLLQLDTLSVWNCSELEQIIDEDEDKDHLQPVCFPKLTSISVGNCAKLKRLFHISVAPSLQKLKRLHMSANDELEEVFWHKDGADVTDYNEIVMNEIRDFLLFGLPNLTNLWPAGYQISFPSANNVIVRNCPKLRGNSEGDR